MEKVEEKEKTYEVGCCPKKRGVFWPLVLVFMGIVLLLNNLGILPWGIWETLIKFWPILVISVGLNMIFGESGIGSFIIGIVFAIAILLVVVIIVAQYDPSFANWMGLNFPNWGKIQNTVPLHRYLPPDQGW